MNVSRQTMVGQEGEEKACNYLKKKGYSILGRNILEKFGEIDILARNGKGVLVFVEVKTVNHGTGFNPEDEMSFAKISKLRKTCEFLANKFPELVRKNGWRIDALCLTKNEKDYDIKHYENIA